MSDIFTAPGLPFWPALPWWAVFLISFALGAGLGHVIRKMRKKGRLS